MTARLWMIAGMLPVLAPAWGRAEAPPGVPPGVAASRDAPASRSPAEDPLATTAGGLTADVAASRAMAASPAVTLRKAEVAAANARVDQAIIQFLPRLSMKASYARTSPLTLSLGGGAVVGAATEGPIGIGPCDPLNPDPTRLCPVDAGQLPLQASPVRVEVPEDNYRATVTLGLPVSDYLLRMSKRLGARRAGERAAALSQRAAELNAATDARIAFYGWARGLASHAVAEASLPRIRALRADTEAALAAGTATQVDLLRVESLLASTELTIAETESLEALAAAQLAVLMNVPTPDFALGEDVRSMPPEVGGDVGATALVEEAHRSRLELRALAESGVSLRLAAEEARRGGLPRLEGVAGYDYGKPNERYLFDPARWRRSWAVGVELSWAINDLLAGNASAREIEAERERLRAELETLSRSLRLEVTAARLDERRARVATESARRGLAAAREAHRLAVGLHRVGRLTTTELLDAEQELLTAALREVSAIIDCRLASIRLLHAIGRDAGDGEASALD